MTEERALAAVPPAIGIRATVSAAGLSAVAILPVFLTGGLSVLIRDDIPFDVSAIGLLVMGFFIASAVASVPGGRLAERAGPWVAALVAMTISATALLALGLASSTVAHLGAFLVMAGFANGIAQPTSSLILARGVSLRRLGFAFGVKQAAIPAATFLVGTAVGALALLVGWRLTYVAWSTLTLVVILAIPRELHHRAGATVRRVALAAPETGLAPLAVLAAGAGAGAAVGTSLASFFVASLVDSGLSPARAGVVLSIASVVGVLARLFLGWWADYVMSGQLRMVVYLSLFGAFSFAAFAFVDGFVPLALLGMLIFAAGWGWPGVFNFVVARSRPSAPASATAITQIGISIGGIVGPFSFGLIVRYFSFGGAWLYAASLTLVSAGLIELGRRLLERGRLHQNDASAASED